MRPVHWRLWCRLHMMEEAQGCRVLQTRHRVTDAWHVAALTSRHSRFGSASARVALHTGLCHLCDRS